jgi:predicted nucleic acid-binding protein
MTGISLIDTNIFIYAFMSNDPSKHAIAADFVKNTIRIPKICRTNKLLKILL